MTDPTSRLRQGVSLLIDAAHDMGYDEALDELVTVSEEEWRSPAERALFDAITSALHVAAEVDEGMTSSITIRDHRAAHYSRHMAWEPRGQVSGEFRATILEAVEEIMGA